MASVDYNQLVTFYHGLPGQATVKQVNEHLIGYLNKTVQSFENAQPSPFTVKQINKISQSLKDKAVASYHLSIAEAINEWAKSWNYKVPCEQKNESSEFRYSAQPLPLKEKTEKTNSSSHDPFSFDELYSNQALRKTDKTYTTKMILDLITKGEKNFSNQISENKNLREILELWKGQKGENVYHLACNKSSFEILSYLSRLGIDLSEKDDDGRNGMHYAVSSQNNEAIIHLFDQGLVDLLFSADNIGHTPLHAAIIDKSSSTFIKMLLNSIQNLQSIPLPSGDNELHLAAKNGFLPAFNFGLLFSSFKHCLAQTNQEGYTPLQIAAMQGHLGIVRLISTLGKDYISKKDIPRAIELASQNNQPTIVEFLTTKTIANAPTYEDLKAHPKRMLQLINQGLDINGLQGGKSMLHRAIEDNLFFLVMAMINEGGALLTAKAVCESGGIVAGSEEGHEEGLPVFYFAISLGRDTIVKYLNDTFYGRNYDFRRLCKFREHPIRFADKFGHSSKISDVLLNRGWEV